MAVGDLIVKDYQYEYSGLLMGASTSIIVKQVEGLYDMPAVRSSDLDRQGQNGTFPGVDLLSGKTIVVDMEVETDTASSLEGIVAQMRNVFKVSAVEIPFVWQRPSQGGKKFMNMRCRRRNISNDGQWARGGSTVVAEMHASDPRWYDLVDQSQPASITDTNTSVTFNCTNNGNERTQPIVTIAGPSTNPRVQNTNDASRTFRTNVILGSLDTLVIDFKKKTVKLNGVDRYDIVTSDSQWFDLVSGNNSLVYTRASSSASSSITVNWNSAYS